MKPLILAVVGIAALGGGAFAGAMLGGGGEPKGEDVHEAQPMHATTPSHFEYVKFNSQFVVPIQDKERVHALLVANLQLEVTEGTTEEAFEREPRLRDAFLKILFDMAAQGAFTDDLFAPDTQTELRGRLLTAAQGVLGEKVNAVLISDFLKQER
jgi:flagellar basal body-associated protein FliL